MDQNGATADSRHGPQPHVKVHKLPKYIHEIMSLHFLSTEIAWKNFRSRSFRFQFNFNAYSVARRGGKGFFVFVMNIGNSRNPFPVYNTYLWTDLSAVQLRVRRVLVVYVDVELHSVLYLAFNSIKVHSDHS